MFYVPYRQDIGHLSPMVTASRAAGSPLSVAAGAPRALLHDLDASLPVVHISTVEGPALRHVLQERVILARRAFFRLIRRRIH